MVQSDYFLSCKSVCDVRPHLSFFIFLYLFFSLHTLMPYDSIKKALPREILLDQEKKKNLFPIIRYQLGKPFPPFKFNNTPQSVL